MSTAIAVAGALTAACCFAIGSVVQQGVARRSGEGTLRPRLLLALFRQPRWVGGFALGVGSFAIQGLALAFGPLTLVQPLAATDVLFALPLIARRSRRRLTGQDYALLAAAILASLFGQSAFGAGALSLSLPVIDSVEPVAAVAIGATIFDERLAASPAYLAVQLAAGAAAVAGITVLSRSSVVKTEGFAEDHGGEVEV